MIADIALELTGGAPGFEVIEQCCVNIVWRVVAGGGKAQHADQRRFSLIYSNKFVQILPGWGERLLFVMQPPAGQHGAATADDVGEGASPICRRGATKPLDARRAIKASTMLTNTNDPARRRANVKVTLRNIHRVDGEVWLWPCSTHPHHQKPLHLCKAPPALDDASQPASDVILLGEVIASWQPAPTDPPT
jgi:hypothetical protein